MNKNMMWIIVIIAFFVGAYAGYSYEKPKLVKNMMMSADLQNQVNTLNGENAKLMKGHTMMKAVTPSPTAAATGGY